MVAVIKTGYSIHRTLNYNENKVKEGVAECISAVNYPKDVSQLSFSNKLNRLINQAALNENVKRKSVHISLNFDPSEKFSHEKLQNIADSYMQKIGFGNQPYLVYKHNDAGHPHIHIVSIKLQANGKRIDTQNIGRNKSEKARKEIEKDFGLVRAEDSRQKQVYELKPVNAQKVQYGRSETKRAITNVLDVVLQNYKYASLPELNAVLRQYNVIADRGSEDSRVFKNNGLLYRVLDEHGNMVGTPIKASDFYSKPTLKFLESQFHSNGIAKQPYKNRVKNSIDMALLRSYLQLTEFINVMQKAGIYTLLRQNDEGRIYGITYVDNVNKCVFNGSDLGKNYSVNAIQDRCKQLTDKDKISELQPLEKQRAGQEKFAIESTRLNHKKFKEQAPNWNRDSEADEKDKSQPGVLNTLLKSESTSDYIPQHFKSKRRRRKRKRNLKHL